ncbi:hypothetical protein [Miniphocaeibacter halophilus]|uniref:Uncharacterized protein n=1 Tax=Miniphocaeibacter halophilus TaxID=2931922 RepID=A0AC61MTH9_9FIRM|nr:hypothetical protein [Miniphocaeibacter halophilus]QQK08114.1 hypothetical protein JFY71_00840 [Miniphocaeibacter halophilus]
MKKLKLILLFSMTIFILVSCSLNNSEEKLIKDFIELNYGSFEEDSKEIPSLSVSELGIKDSPTESENSAGNSNKLGEKYRKFFTEDLYEEIIDKSILYIYIEDINKYKAEVENIDIKYVKDSSLGKKYKVNYTGVVVKNKEVIISEDVESEFTVSEENGNFKISNLHKYKSPWMIIFHDKIPKE